MPITSVPILTTKITAPRPKRQLVQRPRLLNWLEQCRNYNLTLVSAGTGYGKTSLLTNFARISDLNLCWYTLDENDRDPAVFCRYLLQAVRKVYPQFGKSFEELLGYNLTELHQDAIIYRLAEVFVADLEQLELENEANLRDTLILLDDYQFAESFGVNHFVQRLVWLLPPSFHVIISTRVLPEDLSLTKLVAKQMVILLGQVELAFTVEEVKELLSKLYQLNEPELAVQLANYSEGWVTAIILALSNQNGAKSGKLLTLNFTDTSNILNFDVRNVFNYLASEVLEHQSTELQIFLLTTSVFNQLTASSCDALLTIKPEMVGVSSEEILQQLEARNLFITQLVSDEGQSYYQYHSLFHQFLRAKLKQDHQFYRAAHLKAAQIQKNANNHVEAMQHYVEAGEIVRAASLLNEVADTLYQNGRIELLKRLLESIPLENQNQLPHLLNVRARLLLEKGDNEGALQIYRQAELVYKQNQEYDFAARTITNQAQILIRIGKRQEASSLCTQILGDYDTLIVSSEGQQAIALAKYVLGVIAKEQGQIAEAEKNLQEANGIYQATNDYYHLAGVDNTFGQLYQHEGRLVKSNIFYERALSYCIKVGNRKREAYCRVSLAINNYLQRKYKEAGNQFEEVLVAMETLDDQYLYQYVLVYLGNIYRDTERFTKADETYNEGLEIVRINPNNSVELLIINDQATSYILQEKRQEAQNLIDLSLELAEANKVPEHLALSYRNQGWLDYSNQSFKRALTWFQKADTIFEANKGRAERVSSKLAIAMTLMSLGEMKKALIALTESLQLATDLGYEPFLPFELRWATNLFEYAARKKVNEVVEEFLRKHGFFSFVEADTSLEASEVSGWKDLNEPYHLNGRLSKAQSIDNLIVIKSPVNFDLHIYALNGGRVWQDKNEVEKWRTNKTREILFYLLERGKCSREELFEAIWPDEILDTSSSILRFNLSYLRKAIAPVDVIYNSGRYYLEGEIWYDANEFSKEVETVLANRNFDPTRLLKALNLYKRDFLDQFYSNWVLEKQQQLLQLYLRGLEKLARFHQELEEYPAAVTYWKQILLKEPYNEDVYRYVIECLVKMGNKNEARLQAEKCQKALKELDLQPSPQTTLLLQKLA